MSAAVGRGACQAVAREISAQHIEALVGRVHAVLHPGAEVALPVGLRGVAQAHREQELAVALLERDAVDHVVGPRVAEQVRLRLDHAMQRGQLAVDPAEVVL